MNRAEVLKAIRQRHANRQPLNLTAVKRDAPELVEAVYAVEPYWGWKQALSDAGLSYEKIRIEVLEAVVCELCGNRYAHTVHASSPRMRGNFDRDEPRPPLGPSIDPSATATYRPPFQLAGKDCRYYPGSTPEQENK